MKLPEGNRNRTGERQVEVEGAGSVYGAMSPPTQRASRLVSILMEMGHKELGGTPYARVSRTFPNEQ